MKKILILISFTLGLTNTTQAEPLTPTQLHAVLGVVTNFILDDGITHNSTSYGTVTSPYTGRIWLDRNLGASKVCASLDDTACYGDYYQWGRNHDAHQKSNSYDYPVLADNVTNVGHGDFITNGTTPYDWVSVDATGVERTINWAVTDGSSVCPIGFRVPTITELRAELTDVGSANIQDNTDAFNSFLKFPSAGYRTYNIASLTNQGSSGFMWSSSIFGSVSYFVKFGSGFVASMSLNTRASGLTVRCIKGKTHKHNGTTYGEVTSPYTGKVWLDRNLGAKKVCTSFDDTQCYGDYYQWGRNADGHEKSTSSKTASLASNVTDVGDGNFITNSTFPSDWASVDLVGAGRTANWSATDGSSVCPAGFRVPTIVELRVETLDNGVTGRDTAFVNFLKLPSSGYRSISTAFLSGQGMWGYVWSSTVIGLNSRSVGFSGSMVDTDGYYRAFGFVVRCLRD